MVSFYIGKSKQRKGGKAEALAAKIEEHYTDSLELVKQLHDQWWTAHAFWDGRQYIFYQQGRPRTKKAPSWRVRTTHNMIKPTARVLVSKLNQQRPGWECSVENMEYNALMMARLSEDLLEHFYFDLKWGRLSREVDFWAIVTGNGFIKRGFNERTGKPDLWNVTPFDVYPDAKATSMHDARAVVVTHMMSKTEIDNTFGKGTAEKVEGLVSVGEEESHWYKQEIRGHYGHTSKEDLFRVYEYEELPNAENKWRGIKAFSCGRCILYCGDLPGERFSLYHVRYQAGGGRFWGTGFPIDVLDIQQEYNRTHSQIIELRNLHCLPAWVMPMGSVSKSAVVNRPDARIEYNPNLGPAPYRVDPTPIPPSLASYAAQLRDDFQSITGVHDVSFGKADSAAQSGKAMAQLKDSNDLQLGSFFEHKEEVWSQLGEDILEDVKAYGGDEYTFSVMGAGRAPEMRALMANDISTNVRVRSGSMVYTSPSWATQNAKEMFQIGAFGQDPVEALMRFRKSVGSVQGMEEFWGDESMDRLAARQENDLFFSGDPTLVESVHADWPEDHVVHYDEHRRMYFSSEARAPENHEARMALARHMAEHMMQLHAAEQGLPVYQQSFGVPLDDIQSNIQQQMQPGMAEQQPAPQAELPEEQPGMVAGGDPFSNGALLGLQQEQMDPEAHYR